MLTSGVGVGPLALPLLFLTSQPQVTSRSSKMDEIQGKLASMQVDRQASSSSQARADAIVARYLERHHASSPAAMALCKELTATGSNSGEVPDLLELLALHDAQRSSSSALPLSSSDTKSQASLVPPPLPTGPYTYRITATHSSLHPSNILLLRSVTLPTRRFDTSLPSPDFVTTHTPCLLTSGADKRLLFSSSESGEVLDALEPAARPGSGEGHTAPVLDVAQHPLHPRELVAVGMDGTVVLWDLLLRKAVQVRAKDHARFVVRCCWSGDGEWLATAGYDKRINVYRRVAVDGSGMDEDEDEIEVKPLKTRLELCQTINTKGNPEAIVFLPKGAQPPGDKEASASPQQLPWLVWTQRDDCHINYDRVAALNTPTRSLRYNINPTPLDTHISYSLLSLSIHPTLPLLCLITGSHATEGAPTQILLLPFFAGGSDNERVTTIHTTIPSSASYVPRQAWFSRAGEGVWLASEHGRLKLYDLASGEEKVDVGVHGAASEDAEGQGMGAEEKARRWRLGTMNGVIKDV